MGPVFTTFIIRTSADRIHRKILQVLTSKAGVVPYMELRGKVNRHIDQRDYSLSFLYVPLSLIYIL